MKKGAEMVKKIIVLTALVLMAATQAPAYEIGGIEIPDSYKAGDSQLILNGAGLRKKFGIKVYAAGLYLTEKQADGNTILNLDKPMTLIMKWRRKVPPEKINEVFFSSFANSVQAPKQNVYGPDSDYGPLSGDIVRFMSWIAKKDALKNESFIYKYIPNEGTSVYIDTGGGPTHFGTIPGLEFKKALFGIWIGDRQAVGKKLKNKLLGN